MSKILVYGNSEARLPSTYQEVEYLQSSGTQYIQTDVLLTNVYNVEYVATYSDASSASEYYNFIFGYYSTTVGYQSGFVTKTNTISARYGSISISSYNTYPNTRYKVVHGTKGYFISNTQLIEAQTKVDQGSIPLYLFGRTNGTSIDTDARHKGKLYSFICYDSNDNIINNFVPCYRKSDSVAGMYDLVNNVFYTNNGTGTFTVGPDVTVSGYLTKEITSKTLVNTLGGGNYDVTSVENSDGTQNLVITTNSGGVKLLDKTVTFKVGTETKQIVSVLSGNSVSEPVVTGYSIWKDSDENVINFPYTPNANISLFGYSSSRLPSAYQEVQYILLNSNSIINTGYVIDNEDITIEFKAKCNANSTNPFGSSSNSDSNWCNPYANSYGAWGWYFGTSSDKFSGVLTKNTTYAGTLTTQNNTARLQVTEGKTYDNTIDYTGTIINGDNNPIALGGIILNGTASRMTGGHTWYYFNIIVNGSYVKQLVPCYRISDSVPGMYDLTTKTFVTNYGTGTITVGPDVN